MQENNQYELYLKDLVYILKEDAIEAYKKYKKEPNEFNSGFNFAMMTVISLIQNQTMAFDISLKDLKIDDINPEKDLL